MKKFLCYDTNDAASGKINVDNRGMLKPNSTVPSTNGASCQQLVTDGEGGVKWEDRLAYDDSRVVVDIGEGEQLVKVADEVASWATIDTPIKVWASTGYNDTETQKATQTLVMKVLCLRMVWRLSLRPTMLSLAALCSRRKAYTLHLFLMNSIQQASPVQTPTLPKLRGMEILKQ